MVVLGLLISVPIIVWGSTLIIKWVERFPIIIYIGSGVLAWTASKMIVDEPIIKQFYAVNPWMQWGLSFVIVIGVLLLGRIKGKNKKMQSEKVAPAAYPSAQEQEENGQKG